MIDISFFSAFLLTSMVILIAPGPDMAFIISRSIGEGRNAGVATAFGMQIGVFIHICLAAFGLSAILMTSMWAFQIVKYIGAAYLIYLGIQTLRKGKSIVITSKKDRISIKKAFLQGALTDIFNPKVALFFLTFLPQFINPHLSSPIAQFFIFGLMFSVMGLIVDIITSVLASSLRQLLSKNKRVFWWQQKISGITLLSPGTWLAFEKRS
ncbi:LysE family translocator [Sporolactobacillus shoreicorticis]|uniref:LysE family translocator n=1 Tax=Sporolactobacillus shoreicorticis TaxID=1923877 RepID=A0ABW5S389_9BACL|nr:LysE family translocator [Sporolactobacillus shoreicorticis]MCO7126525.1 LysE family translocator [Sporolactobacillus shoreicorticis]